VDGNTTVLANGQATWQLAVPKPVTATITFKSATGVQVYSGTRPLNTGTQAINWDGKDSSGLQWPDGNYTITVTAQDTSGKPVAIPTEIEAVVDSADLSQTPPVLSIAGQDYTVDKIKRVIRTSN
jgi:flagellar basal-body rod modification protein FlgD